MILPRVVTERPLPYIPGLVPKQLFAGILWHFRFRPGVLKRMSKRMKIMSRVETRFRLQRAERLSDVLAVAILG
jgi:hypothetical protein